MKHKLKVGWTKEKVMEKIRAGNYGTVSVSESGRCVYRGPTGNKCVIGCFIPDERYDPWMEGKDIGLILSTHPQLGQFMPFSDEQVLANFQFLHDCCVLGENIYLEVERFLAECVE